MSTMAVSPFNMVGRPSSHPAIILLLPRTILRGAPLPVIRISKRLQTLISTAIITQSSDPSLLLTTGKE